MFEGFFNSQKNKFDLQIQKGYFTNWEEHCTECAIPDCYTMCSLYRERKDSRCKRFENGIEKDSSGGRKIIFKRWAKLETRVYFFNNWLPKVILNVCTNLLNVLFSFVPFRITRGIRNRWWFGRHSINMLSKFFHFLASKDNVLNTCIFNFELNSKTNKTLIFKLTSKTCNFNYTKKLEAKVGFNFFDFSFPKVSKINDLICSFEIADSSDVEIIIQELGLFFQKSENNLDDVNLRLIDRADKVKCIVWDLDNTLWYDVLIEMEDWKNNLRVKQEFIDFIKFSDSRGLLHSIASKNNLNQVLDVLEYLGISDYFLFPQASWGPKSLAMSSIADSLNIGVDSLVLIDDSEYEREEVSFSLADVVCLNPNDFHIYKETLNLICSRSKLGSERRLSYLAESSRKSFRKGLGEVSDTAFLRTLDINVTISSNFNHEQEDRCFELIQRTNQLNLRTYRYSRNEFNEMFSSHKIRTFHFSVSDRFGDYGLVGFLSYQLTKDSIVLDNLVISCRVAQKKIESAILRKLFSNIDKKIVAKFFPTDRNEILFNVLKESGFVVLDSNEQFTLMEFKREYVEFHDFIKVIIL